MGVEDKVSGMAGGLGLLAGAAFGFYSGFHAYSLLAYYGKAVQYIGTLIGGVAGAIAGNKVFKYASSGLNKLFSYASGKKKDGNEKDAKPGAAKAG